MKSILRITSSPRGHQSESYRLSQAVVERLIAQYPAARLIERPLAGAGAGHVDEDYADVLGGFAAPAGKDHLGTLAASEQMIRELEETDCLVIGTPMHNYTVPSNLKAWIDHVVRVYRSFQPTRQGKIGTLRDRPTFVAVASGGTYADEPPRQPDFLTPYLTAVLNTIGIRDITFFSVQGTAADPDKVRAARSCAIASIDAHFHASTVQRGAEIPAL